jgi:hypothetical protein
LSRCTASTCPRIRARVSIVNRCGRSSRDPGRRRPSACRDLQQLSAIRPFSWSTYRLTRDSDRVDYHQLVGRAAGRDVGDVGWDGREVIAFRMHLPSEILFENSGAGIQRGNILEWEQPLASRLESEPLDLRVQMAPESILYTTLMLFGSTVVAAALAFAVVIWWVARRGRDRDTAELHA